MLLIRRSLSRDIRSVLEFDPGYADLAVKVAYELARRNDVSGGIQVLKDCIKASPKEALPLIYLSQLYSKYLKKPDLALKYAEQALALAPDNFASYLANFELHLQRVTRSARKPPWTAPQKCGRRTPTTG